MPYQVHKQYDLIERWKAVTVLVLYYYGIFGRIQ